MNKKEIMTAKQISEHLQMNEYTVYKLVRSVLILFYKNRWAVAV